MAENQNPGDLQEVVVCVPKSASKSNPLPGIVNTFRWHNLGLYVEVKDPNDPKKLIEKALIKNQSGEIKY